MRRYSALFLSGLVLTFFGLTISSCKDDPEPFVKPKLSFTEPTLTVNEGDKTFTVEVTLDKPTIEDFTISYTLKGTAVDKVAAGTTSAYDYEITSEYLEVEIPEGESTGIIEIKLYSDLSLELDEIIEIEIEDIDSDNIEITRDDSMEITVSQEDGLLVFLAWGIADGEDYQDVDMDLFFWAKSSAGALVPTNYRTDDTDSYTNLNGNPYSPEVFFVPDAGFADGDYGLSYNYYAGTVEPMNYEVTFAKLVSGEIEAEANWKVYNGLYMLDNIHAWDVTGDNPVLAQTFKKVGSVYSNFSALTNPDISSRTKSTGDLSNLKKLNISTQESAKLNSYLKKLGYR
jgi:hypothetical protein